MLLAHAHLETLLAHCTTSTRGRAVHVLLTLQSDWATPPVGLRHTSRFGFGMLPYSIVNIHI